jgi:hypothetical protein
MCISELKEAMLGLSCLGSRGLVPLLSNLCSSHSEEQIQALKKNAPECLEVRCGAVQSEP